MPHTGEIGDGDGAVGGFVSDWQQCKRWRATTATAVDPLPCHVWISPARRQTCFDPRDGRSGGHATRYGSGRGARRACRRGVMHQHPPRPPPQSRTRATAPSRPRPDTRVPERRRRRGDHDHRSSRVRGRMRSYAGLNWPSTALEQHVASHGRSVGGHVACGMWHIRPTLHLTTIHNPARRQLHPPRWPSFHPSSPRTSAASTGSTGSTLVPGTVRVGKCGPSSVVVSCRAG